MRALFVSASLVITIALTSVLASAADDAPVAEPTIDSVTPGILAPWTYVVVDGTDLANEDGTCDVKLGSVQAYIEDCSPGQIVAIVPWSPGADTLSVSSAGAASDSQLVSVSGDAPAADQIIAGRLHVNLVDGASIAQVLDANEVLALGAHELAAPGDYYTKGWYRVDVVEGTEIAVALSIMADPDVLYAGPVPRPIPQAEPNDPLYSSQWYLAKIDMPGAWNVSKGSGTKIAIIDTGFDASHPDLSGRLLPGWNCDGGTSVSAPNERVSSVAPATRTSAAAT